LTLFIFGPKLEEKKYCDIDSFTFCVGLQSVVVSGISKSNTKY